jgi:hypothetical protein
MPLGAPMAPGGGVPTLPPFCVFGGPAVWPGNGAIIPVSPMGMLSSFTSFFVGSSLCPRLNFHVPVRVCLLDAWLAGACGPPIVASDAAPRAGVTKSDRQATAPKAVSEITFWSFAFTFYTCFIEVSSSFAGAIAIPRSLVSGDGPSHFKLRATPAQYQGIYRIYLIFKGISRIGINES